MFCPLNRLAFGRGFYCHRAGVITVKIVQKCQQRIAFERNESRVGTQVDVLIVAPVPDESNAWIGRTASEAPDIDGVVYVSGEGLEVGKLVNSEIVAAHGYDLIAAAVDQPR